MPSFRCVEPRLRHATVRAHAITAQPAGRRKLHVAGERPGIGEQQQALAVEIETAYRDDAGQLGGQARKDRWAPLRVLVGRDQPAGLIVAPQPYGLALWQRFTIDDDGVALGDLECGCRQDLTVDADAPIGDPSFGLAARAHPCVRHRFGDAHGTVLSRRCRLRRVLAGAGALSRALTGPVRFALALVRASAVVRAGNFQRQGVFPGGRYDRDASWRADVCFCRCWAWNLFG